MVVILLGVGATFLGRSEGMYSEARTIGQGIATFQELEERFEMLSETKGAVYGYEVLRRAVLPPNTDFHLLGHTVGNLLYIQKGVGGIADCTPEFRNACSHAVVIGAFNEFGGEAALDLIRDACRSSPGGPGAYTMCYHGLGHGVFAFYDYSLPETVALCEKTGTDAFQNREATECIGGAVMELTGGGGHNPELWHVSRTRYLISPLAPCTSDVIPGDAKRECLMYLTPEIWKSVGIDLAQPDPELFGKAFATCDTLTDTSLRRACFGGFGKEFVPLVIARDVRNIATFAEKESALVSEWCAQARVLDGVTACVEQALQSLFWGGENDPEISFRFCQEIHTGQRAACFSELGDAIASYVREGNRRVELCNRLPKQNSLSCLQNKIWQDNTL
ncbi:MAG: hypothetical protein AAB421_05650 [Patescibacteria group bacterium]